MSDNLFNNLNWDEIYQGHDAVYKSRASVGSPDRTFVGWDANTSVKSSYTKGDYNYFRSNSRGCNSRRNMLKVCQEAYKRVSIIQNVINLMSDFGSKGIRFRHKDKKIEKLCQTWGDKVGLGERSSSFLNCLYRHGTVIIYESFGRVDATKPDSKYVPVKYTFLDPGAVKIKEEDSNIIPENPTYLMMMYSSDSDRVLQRNGGSVPEILKDRISKPLNSEKLSVYNYRKDDWEFWGTPITYSILDQLEMLEKLQLADISALDGVISQVRLWTVGKITDNPQTTFMPTKPMLEKIRNVLANGLGGGTMDVVWGPELDFKESTTTVHQFLGEGKYKPVLDAIYDGLGIPSPLRSSNKDGGGNNPISLKTLIERLNYGRLYLISFWTKQLKKLFKALGITTDLPVIEFDYMVLTDEAAEKKLLIDLADRDIIDSESVLERFHFDPEIVKTRLQKEVGQRGEALPEKAGPFHNPHIQDDMKKTLLANQSAAPYEVGLDVNVPEDQQKKRFTMPPQKKTAPGVTGIAGTKTKKVAGRPPNKTETSKRAKKGTGPSKSKAVEIAVWASSAQKQISDIFTPVALSVYNKKNVRSLSVKETEALEYTKAKILLSFDAFAEVNTESVQTALNKEINPELLNQLNFIQVETAKGFGRELTTDEKRHINSLFYAGVSDGEDSSDI